MGRNLLSNLRNDIENIISLSTNVIIDTLSLLSKCLNVFFIISKYIIFNIVVQKLLKFIIYKLIYKMIQSNTIIKFIDLAG